MRASNGYTITELMVTVALVGALASVAAPLLIRVNNFWEQTVARNIIERDVRVAVETINRFVRQGKSGTMQVDSVAGQPPYSRITFLTAAGDFIQIYQTNNILYMRKNSNTTILTKNVAYIAFTYPRSEDSSIVSVAITTQYPTYLGQKKALQLSIQKVRVMN